MRILLIYPSTLDSNKKVIKYKQAFLPPLSLAILNSLTPPNITVEVINDIVEQIDFTKKYDLVAITAMTTQIERAYQIADSYREQGTKVILGGIHPTAQPEEARKHADSIVIGEADELWESILADCANNNLKQVYKNESFSDLTRLVIPKWDNMNMSIYPRRVGGSLPMMPIFTTRGCPNGCKFCSVTKFFGKSYRTKPISNVLEEIKNTKAKDYFFVDDNIASIPDYSRDLFRALPKHNISWLSQISTTVLKNPDLIELAAKAGCSYLFIGMESLNKESLASANKKFNNIHQYEELIQRMQKAGIVPFLSFIFGFDEDSLEQFEITLRFIKKNNIGFSTFWILTPLPGTDLYSSLNSQNRINNKDWSKFNLSNVVFQPENMTKDNLYNLYWENYKKLYTWRAVISSIYNNVKVSNTPFDEFMRTSFYQTYYRKKVNNHDHPFSGGIGRIN